MNEHKAYHEQPAPHPTALRLFHGISNCYGEALAGQIAFDTPLSVTATGMEKAAWVRHVTAELEKRFPKDAVRSIMMACHCKDACRLEEMKTWLGGLYKESASLDDFVDRVNRHDAGWFIRDGAVYTKFLWCECHMLTEVESLPSQTWCHCTEGYTKALFEHVFGCEVESELLQTIKTGHDFCLVKITPKTLKRSSRHALKRQRN